MLTTRRWPPAGLALLQQKWSKELGTVLPRARAPKGKERRRYKRIAMPPLVILSRSLSDLPILPEDLSMEGFCAVFATPIRVNTIYMLRMVLADQIIEACQAKVIWAKANNTMPATWTLGLRLLFPDGGDKLLGKFLKIHGAVCAA